MNITGVETIPLALPAPRPRVSLADPRPPQTVAFIAVRVQTDSGAIGIGFTASPNAGRTLRTLLEGELAPLVVGEDPTETERLFAKAQARFRMAGWAGLAARAYAAIDIALWDLKGKAWECPHCRVLGSGEPRVPT